MGVRKLSSQAKNYVTGLQGKISKSNTGLVVPVSTTQSGNLLIHGHQIEYPESFASVVKKISPRIHIVMVSPNESYNHDFSESSCFQVI